MSPKARCTGGPDVSAGSAASSAVAAMLMALTVIAGCTAPASGPVPSDARPARESRPGADLGAGNGLPGMPPVTDPHNVYAAAGAGMLSGAARGAGRWSTCRTPSPATSG